MSKQTKREDAIKYFDAEDSDSDDKASRGRTLRGSRGGKGKHTFTYERKNIST